ncbi:MAG: TonB-dependent receptor [Euryarchaeota archaeon]|nr:TonB-dependent receptor [Euryarchaeota archaeon]
MRKALLLLSLVFISVGLHAQSVIRGKVIDGETGEPMFSASVVNLSSGQGVTTDFDGLFRLEVNSLPVELKVSFIGYNPKTITVTDFSSKLEIKLMTDQILIEAAEVVGDRISEKQKQAPLTVESMDLIAIKEAPSGNFYEGLGNLKGVDLTSASLGFKIINTRGFNSTSPVRSLQLIDGVDNQSPGLNFSLGNFLGAPDLDVKNVEIVAGASSAFFGPGAFNGVVNMETKDPFVFPGLSVSTRFGEKTKKGETNLFELGLRWAQVIENKDEDPVFAYKINAFKFKAYDWEATNYDPIQGSFVDANNPGRYDAVNIYGDEFRSVFDYSGDNSDNSRGLGTFYRNGYREADLVDYNTENFKFSTSAHWRLQPDKTYESPELIYSFNMGTGTTVYQGDNRFSLRDIEFYQHRVELRKKNKWFVRAYRTSEDAGNSYDPYATALKLQDSTRSDAHWSMVYNTYWVDSIGPTIDDSYPPLEILYWDSVFNDCGDLLYTVPVAGVDQEAENQWWIDYADSLSYWHQQVMDWTNTGNAGIPGLIGDSVGYLVPGTEEFDQLFNKLITTKNNEGEGGTRFHDLSSLIHVHGEYKITEIEGIEEIRIGANFRQYNPVSEGTIFSDTADVVIINREVGAYLGIEKRFMEDKMIATGTVRVDKNQNFEPIVSPALSLVWTPNSRDFARLSFSSALRNPTLADQYLYLDVGPATLVGNLNGSDTLYTIQSFIDYRESSSGLTGDISANIDALNQGKFKIDAIQPEQVRTLEFGYRTTIGEGLYIDYGAYMSWYTNFIGYNIGLDIDFHPEFTDAITGIDVYRYAANSNNTVVTQGSSIGLQYYLEKNYMLSGNYSWNRLVKTNEDDPIIPAFNTPEHKFNLGISARDLDLGGENAWGFGFNYKWVQQFVFEGSPQFTGVIPQYGLVDGQVNFNIDKLNTTFKVGASNILKNLHIETYGGPLVGRMAYFSVLYEFNQ